jgi:hypothetical protein
MFLLFIEFAPTRVSVSFTVQKITEIFKKSLLQTVSEKEFTGLVS